MRRIATKTALIVILPAALALSACGGNSADEAATDTGETATVETPAGGAEYPQVPLDARGTVEYQGTYSQALADGRSRSLTLGTADSYTMTDEDGVESTGTFSWYSDNSRILVGSGDNKMIFAVADGMLYELPDGNAGVDAPRTPENVWTKSDASAATPAM